mmetsp:Transcript_119033/g.186757  ORF Transcript_119033/g.186757 Transcript_119033/m.186757 type:complete len:213 (-) Transcript_119033:84-722(-)
MEYLPRTQLAPHQPVRFPLPSPALVLVLLLLPHLPHLERPSYSSFLSWSQQPLLQLLPRPLQPSFSFSSLELEDPPRLPLPLQQPSFVSSSLAEGLPLLLHPPLQQPSFSFSFLVLVPPPPLLPPAPQQPSFSFSCQVQGRSVPQPRLLPQRPCSSFSFPLVLPPLLPLLQQLLPLLWQLSSPSFLLWLGRPNHQLFPPLLQRLPQPSSCPC